MGGMSKSSSGGQRGNITSASGRKERSPTSRGQSGSRVEPSHTNGKKQTSAAKSATRKAAGKEKG